LNRLLFIIVAICIIINNFYNVRDKFRVSKNVRKSVKCLNRYKVILILWNRICHITSGKFHNLVVLHNNVLAKNFSNLCCRHTFPPMNCHKRHSIVQSYGRLFKAQDNQININYKKVFTDINILYNVLNQQFHQKIFNKMTNKHFHFTLI